MGFLNKPVHTRTPSGEEIVILPAEDYVRLLEMAEDARDLAIAEAALENLRSGKAELLTQTEVREFLAAPTPLSFWRKRRDLTQAALAERVGISQAYLAQIERGKWVGDIQLYRRLAGALRLEMEDIAAPAVEDPASKRGSPRGGRSR